MLIGPLVRVDRNTAVEIRAAFDGPFKTGQIVARVRHARSRMTAQAMQRFRHGWMLKLIIVYPMASSKRLPESINADEFVGFAWSIAVS